MKLSTFTKGEKKWKWKINLYKRNKLFGIFYVELDHKSSSLFFFHLDIYNTANSLFREESNLKVPTNDVLHGVVFQHGSHVDGVDVVSGLQLLEFLLPRIEHLLQEQQVLHDSKCEFVISGLQR